MTIKLVPLAEIISNVLHHEIPTTDKIYKIYNTPHGHVKPIRYDKNQ